MSGLLENLVQQVVQAVVQQALPAIAQQVAQTIGGNQAQQNPAANAFGGQQVQQNNPFGGAQQGNPFGGAAAQTQQPQVTADMLTELATKLVTNEAAKAAAMQAMQSLGIPSMPETRPDQWPALFGLFKQIEAQFFGAPQNPAGGNPFGGAGGGTGGVSII